MKLYLLVALFLSALGGTFYLVHLGKEQERAKQLGKEADAARDDIYIKQKQDKILAGRNRINIIDILRKGEF